jgi:transposase-like protein
MSDSVDCPYCEKDTWIDYEGGNSFETQCEHCEKYFEVEVEFDPIFSSKKACEPNEEKHHFIRSTYKRDDGDHVYYYRCKICDYQASDTDKYPLKRVRDHLIQDED